LSLSKEGSDVQINGWDQLCRVMSSHGLTLRFASLCMMQRVTGYQIVSVRYRKVGALLDVEGQVYVCCTLMALIVCSGCFILARDDGSEDKSDDVDLAPLADRCSECIKFVEKRGYQGGV
jgi:hypothetical protein